MRYEGICCGTCGWFENRVEPAWNRCHHSSQLSDRNVSEDWWCENWIADHRAEAFFRNRELTLEKLDQKIASWPDNEAIVVDERIDP